MILLSGLDLSMLRDLFFDWPQRMQSNFIEERNLKHLNKTNQRKFIFRTQWLHYSEKTVLVFFVHLLNHKSIEVYEIKNYSHSKESQRRKTNRLICHVGCQEILFEEIRFRIYNNDKQQLKLISLCPNVCSYY